LRSAPRLSCPADAQCRSGGVWGRAIFVIFIKRPLCGRGIRSYRPPPAGREFWPGARPRLTGSVVCRICCRTESKVQFSCSSASGGETAGPALHEASVQVDRVALALESPGAQRPRPRPACQALWSGSLQPLGGRPCRVLARARRKILYNPQRMPSEWPQAAEAALSQGGGDVFFFLTTLRPPWPLKIPPYARLWAPPRSGSGEGRTQPLLPRALFLRLGESAGPRPAETALTRLKQRSSGAWTQRLEAPFVPPSFPVPERSGRTPYGRKEPWRTAALPEGRWVYSCVADLQDAAGPGPCGNRKSPLTAGPPDPRLSALRDFPPGPRWVRGNPSPPAAKRAHPIYENPF